MSALLDKIEKAHQESPRRMGFGPSTKERTPPLPLLVGVARPEVGSPAQEVSQHLDALLFKVNTIQEVEALSKDQTVSPWGVWVDTPTPELVPPLKERGGDLLLFSPEQTPLEMVQDQGLTRLLLVPLEWDHRLVPALHDLPVDAVALALSENTPLTVQQLMAVGGLRRLAGKPLLLFLARSPSQKELEALRDSGVDCILLDVTANAPQEVEAVRRHINDLPPRRRRERERPTAVVPQMPTGAGSRVEEEEEEEEEDF